MMRKIITVQGLYYLLTEIWPLIHIYSFVWVTGYKTDIWLVKMVALLSCAIGITLLFSGRDQNKSTKVLGISTAVAFALIDIYYNVSEVISRIYLLDALIQLVFLVALLLVPQNNPVKGP